MSDPERFPPLTDAMLRGGDPVQHPSHYTSHPSGVECRTIIRHMNFNLGSAVKYVWRAGLKGDPVVDLRKAINCLEDEIARIEGERGLE